MLEGATHRSCRSIAKQTILSKSTVQRMLSAFNLQPHRQKHFTLSTDLYFVEKERGIVGLYLNPPDKAMVICVDEKSQALDRTQPVSPMGLGYVEGITTTAIPRSLYANIFLMAELGGNLVSYYHSKGYPARFFPQHQTTAGENRSIY